MQNNKPLNSYDRVHRLITRQSVDRTPKGELVIDKDVLHEAGYLDGGFDETLEFVQSMGLDLVTLSPDIPKDPARLPQVSEYHWADLRKWGTQTSLFTFAILDGAFEWGLRFFTPLDFLTMLVQSPDTVKEFVHQIEETNLLLAERLVGEGIDGIILADDIATQNGLYARPAILRNMFLPSLARQVEAIQTKNIPVFFHSDGDYTLVMDDIVNAGFAGLHCLDKSSNMEISAIQRRLGDKVCLWGHLDVDDIARSGDYSFRTNLIHDIHQLALQDRLILGTTSGLFNGMDIQLLKEVYSLV